MQSVPGWFDHLDAALICEISDWQQSAGMRGDIVEIGVYHGRSAVLFGFLLGAGERFVACDPFDDKRGLSAENHLWNGRFYPGLTRDAFERNYIRWHGTLPVIAAVPSAALGHIVPAGSCRLVHVDGAHDHRAVAADARMSRVISMPGAVAVFDDWCKAHLPGAALAVWEQVASGVLLPVALTDAKLYGCWSMAEADALRGRLAEWAASQPGIRVDEHLLADRVVPRIVPRPAPSDWPRES
jgi:hypothetical protein